MTSNPKHPEKRSTEAALTIASLAAVMTVAGVAYCIQYKNGLIMTNMSNGFSWGLYVSGLAFFVGNAAGGLVLSSSIYMFGLTSLKPFARIGALTAFVNVIAAMLSILPDIGQPLRIWHMLVYPQMQSPLVWDVIVLNCYAALSLAYLIILMLPDLSGRLKRLTKMIKDPEAFSDTWARRLAPFALFFAASIHIVTAWIFSTQGGREWWHTAALAPDFLSVAVMAGTTVVLLASVLLLGLDHKYTDAYKTMSKIILAALIIHLFLMYNDIFIKTWYHAEAELHAIRILSHDFLSAHIFEVAAPLTAAILLMGRAVWKSRPALVSTCLLLLSGVLVHRYLIIPPAFNAQPLTLIPLGFQETQWSYPVANGRWIENADTFSSVWPYFPSTIEWLVFAGVCAFACLAIAIVAAILPVAVKDKTKN